MITLDELMGLVAEFGSAAGGDVGAGSYAAYGKVQSALAELVATVSEQKATIEHYKSAEESNNQNWTNHHRRVERLVSKALALLKNPTVDARSELRQAISGLGYCLLCHGNPCECEDHDY